MQLTAGQAAALLGAGALVGAGLLALAARAARAAQPTWRPVPDGEAVADGSTYRWSQTFTAGTTALSASTLQEKIGWTDPTVWLPTAHLPADWPADDAALPGRIRFQAVLSPAEKATIAMPAGSNLYVWS